MILDFLFGGLLVLGLFWGRWRGMVSMMWFWLGLVLALGLAGPLGRNYQIRFGEWMPTLHPDVLAGTAHLTAFAFIMVGVWGLGNFYFGLYRKIAGGDKKKEEKATLSFEDRQMGTLFGLAGPLALAVLVANTARPAPEADTFWAGQYNGSFVIDAAFKSGVGQELGHLPSIKAMEFYVPITFRYWGNYYLPTWIDAPNLPPVPPKPKKDDEEKPAV